MSDAGQAVVTETALALPPAEQIRRIAGTLDRPELWPVVRALREVEDGYLMLTAKDLGHRIAGLMMTRPASCQTAEDATACSRWRQDCADVRRAVVAAIQPVCQERYAAHRTATGVLNSITDTLDTADKAASRAIAAWHAAELRRAAEAQAKAEADARAAAAAAARAEQDERTARAIERGRIAVAAPVVAAPAAPAGTQMRETWEVELTDKAAFLRAVVEGCGGAPEIPLEWVNVDLGSVRRMVIASKGAVKYPGVTARRVTQAARGR